MEKRILLIGFIGVVWSASACTEEALIDFIDGLHHPPHGDADIDTDVDTAVDTEYCEECYYNEEGVFVCEIVPCNDGCYVDGELYLVGEEFGSECSLCVCEAPGELICYDVEDCGRNSYCDDGTIPMCDMVEPDCEEPFEILAWQDDCYRCVNPATCHPWGVSDCETDSDCSSGAVCEHCGTSSCPTCDDCVTACVIIDFI